MLLDAHRFAAAAPPPAGPDLEAGLTPGGIIPAGETFNPSVLDRSGPAVFAVDFVGLAVDPGGQSMIVEMGQGAQGAYAGLEPDGRLMVRYGVGSTRWDNRTTYYFSDQPLSGDGTLVVELDRAVSSLRVWWQGAPLPGTTTPATNIPNTWTGAETASYLTPAENAVGNEEFTRIVQYTSASELRYYPDRIAQ
ncbi:MAG: hypothetical protein AAFW69_08025 [Pseudomonadota bacterium]